MEIRREQEPCKPGADRLVLFAVGPILYRKTVTLDDAKPVTSRWVTTMHFARTDTVPATQRVQFNPAGVIVTAYPGADGLAELPSHIKVLTKPFRRAFLLAQVKALVSEAPPVLPDEALELVENRAV